jgi:hypothetical protein
MGKEYRRWSVHEDRILQRIYSDRHTRDVARYLPGRSAVGIHKRARKLGIFKTFRRWSVREDRILRRIYSHRRTGDVVCNLPGRSVASLHQRAQKLGLSKNPRVMATGYVPVGTTRKHHGYWMVKVGEPTQWRRLHRVVWEATHGPVPRGALVTFRDGDADNCAPENLVLTTRQDIMRQHTYHNYPQPIPHLVQLRGILTRQINRRARREEQA